MLKNKLPVLLVLITFQSYFFYAQDTDYLLINGEVIDEQKEPVSFVNISVKGKAAGVFSKEDGKFSIKAQVNDTLSFSALGYKTLKMPVKMLNSEYNYITLFQQIYQLEGIDIMAARWQEFKYDMMHKELKPIEQKIIVIDGLPNPYTVLVPAKPSPIMNPATFWYEFFKKENIRKRKQKRWSKIYEKSYIKVEK